jgi:hypothetical protein
LFSPVFTSCRHAFSACPKHHCGRLCRMRLLIQFHA